MGFKPKVPLTESQLKALENAIAMDLKTFFTNVDTLSVQRFGSRNEAIKALRVRTGFSMHPDTVRKYKMGLFLRADLLRLESWCLLFGEPLYKMLSVDYAAEALL